MTDGVMSTTSSPPSVWGADLSGTLDGAGGLT